MQWKTVPELKNKKFHSESFCCLVGNGKNCRSFWSSKLCSENQLSFSVFYCSSCEWRFTYFFFFFLFVRNVAFTEIKKRLLQRRKGQLYMFQKELKERIIKAILYIGIAHSLSWLTKGGWSLSTTYSNLYITMGCLFCTKHW